jgi:hypothetical protein
MNAKPVLAQSRAVPAVVAAALSAVIGLGLLSAVTGLFQRDGAPFEQLVVAERACANHAYASERATCVQSYLAAARHQSVASR